MNEQHIIWGTEVKYLLALTAPGFDMNTDNFCVDVSCSGKNIHFRKQDLVYDVGEDKWYLCFDTKYFRSGEIVATVTAYITDGDFSDGIRDEVVRVKIGQLKK